jgi:hypothetical protein
MLPREMDKLATRVREVMAEMYYSRSNVSAPEVASDVDAKGSVVT